MENQDSAETAGTPAPGGPYEFSDEDNVLFKGLAWRMSVLGFFLLVLATLNMPALLAMDGVATALAWLFTVTGAWSFFTAYSVRGIAQTEGHDISHLMKALNSVRHLLTLGVVLVVVLVSVAAKDILAAGYDKLF